MVRTRGCRPSICRDTISWRAWIDLRRDGDRVEAHVGLGAVDAPALDGDGEGVARGEEGAGGEPDLPGLLPAADVEAEDRLHLRVVEGALGHHERRAALLALGGPLLGRLEEEDHGPRQAVLEPGEDLGGAEEHRGVGVVAAGVHDPGGLALVGRVAAPPRWAARRCPPAAPRPRPGDRPGGHRRRRSSPPGGAPPGRASGAARRPALPVRSSRLLSSGWACRSRRIVDDRRGRSAPRRYGSRRRARRPSASSSPRVSNHRLLLARAAIIRPVRRVPRDVLLPALAGLVLIVAAFVLPPQLHGDAGEYLLTLESFHGHRSPELQPRDIASLRGLLQDAGQSLDESRILPNYHRGHDGRLYCYHFWGYSLAGLPARHLLGALGLDPLRALPLTNAAPLRPGAALDGAPALEPDATSRAGGASAVLSRARVPPVAAPRDPVVRPRHGGAVSRGVGPADPRRSGGRPAALQNPPLVLLVGLLWVVAVAEALGAAGSGERRSLTTWARAVLGPTLAARRPWPRRPSSSGSSGCSTSRSAPTRRRRASHWSAPSTSCSTPTWACCPTRR